MNLPTLKIDIWKKKKRLKYTNNWNFNAITDIRTDIYLYELWQSIIANSILKILYDYFQLIHASCHILFSYSFSFMQLLRILANIILYFWCHVFSFSLDWIEFLFFRETIVHFWPLLPFKCQLWNIENNILTSFSSFNSR